MPAPGGGRPTARPVRKPPSPTLGAHVPCAQAFEPCAQAKLPCAQASEPRGRGSGASRASGFALRASFRGPRLEPKCLARKPNCLARKRNRLARKPPGAALGALGVARNGPTLARNRSWLAIRADRPRASGGIHGWRGRSVGLPAFDTPPPRPAGTQARPFRKALRRTACPPLANPGATAHTSRPLRGGRWRAVRRRRASVTAMPGEDVCATTSRSTCAGWWTGACT